MTLLPVFSMASTGTTLNHPGTSRATCSHHHMPALVACLICAHSVTHIGLYGSSIWLAYPAYLTYMSRQLCLHVCAIQRIASLFIVKVDEQINTPTQALLKPAKGMRHQLSMILSKPPHAHKLAEEVHGWPQVWQARVETKFQSTCIDVSLLSSRRPGSAEEPHRTLFSIVAENLLLAASTAGDPSSCTQLNVSNCSFSALTELQQ